MSKILFCCSNAILKDGVYQIASFYEEIITELARFGNDVLVYIPNSFQSSWFGSENPLKSEIDEEKLRKDISDFNPDLVITFNNAAYNRLLDVVNCDVVAWGADLEFYWNQREYIKQNIDRYFLFCFAKKEIEYRKTFFGCADNRIFHVKTATSFVSTSAEKKTNVSFIGTCFGTMPDISSLLPKYAGLNEFKEIMKRARKRPDTSLSELAELAENVPELKNEILSLPPQHFEMAYARDDRFMALDAVADLGLDLYGDDGWISRTDVPHLVAASKKRRIVFSAKENEEIYNESKLCLNAQSGQSYQGMTYRVCDIMATSGCLVSSYSPFIEKCFKGINIPFYEHPADARAVCKKLLDNENMRLDIVAACNEIIDKEWRWKHRFKEIEEITGVSLFSDKKGKFSVLQPVFKEELKMKEEETIDDMGAIRKFKYKLLYKIYKKLKKKLARKGII